MKHVSVVVLGVSICLSGCMISPQKRGTVSIEGIGTKVLTEKGDQLMQTGVYAKREVSRSTSPKDTRKDSVTRSSGNIGRCRTRSASLDNMFRINHIGFKWKCMVVATTLLCGEHAKGYILVEDIPNLSTNIVNEVKNYVQYLSQTANQVTQITNQVTQIENQVIALERFGNPQYYVNLLGLSSFMATASVLTSGIGQTLSSYRQAANGVTALGYTANGLYSNLTGSLDRYGNPIRYNTDAFRKFAAVNDMVEGYNTQQRTFNAQMASLQQQLTTAMQNLNAASTQMETEKYAAQVNAIHAQINALSQTTNLTGQRAAVQQLSNQNDAARVQEASRQQEIQERQTDLQNEATGFANLVGGQQP